ncbi:hypothetical protein BK120_08245 [Paenibacillus sp. FSL A5-0031]|uniref:hypothetical protein n=1 Tax=Paenibacillus sp. FSL A5-0031 TaxID=1920420 RepID=UPI00096EEA40|nr:hypothetical protein [Paenibacillus sp. FSL A5-0031]OME86903.1 hypothetical protein BK120_08245 [Paenibacillus sp. FSL A5-0031]
MTKRSFCRFCSETHTVSETKDPNGIAVGLFCDRRKELITAFTSLWGDEDVFPLIESYVDAAVDSVALKRIKSDKVVGLSRKIAYQFMQTSNARERKINYYFALHHVLDAIRAKKGRLFYANGVY